MDHSHRPIKGKPLRRANLALLATLAPLLLSLSARADAVSLSDIADMSIEELANIQVTSVSKKPERLADAASSVFVITAEDIRRSGAPSLPDVLRLAPNLQVAQSSGSAYNVSARGMNGVDGAGPNKLLVLIDGRSVYTPLFSGVFWDTQDVLLDDIERIEVISGPGGTLWGVNAVNGVINITTRNARETQGSQLVLAGRDRGADASFRVGGASGANGAWRVYGKFLKRAHTELVGGGRVDDAWHKSQIGFRADWVLGEDRISVNGNAYTGSIGQPLPGSVSIRGTKFQLDTISISGANLTGHWTRALAGGGGLSAQAYLDHSKRNVPPSFAEELDLFDLQLQHSLPALGAHSLVWGANYRHSHDRVANSEIIAFLPGNLNQTWASLFAQDEIALREDLRLTVGSRFERNDYTGNEFLPTVRLAWKSSRDHSFWAGASRTVRAPSRLDVDAHVPGRPPYVLDGGRKVRSELARVFELGYRGRPMPHMSWSATAFYNDYDHLRTQEVAPSGRFVTFDSKMEGKARGLEMWGNYQLSPNWRVSGGLLALHEHFTLKPGSNNTTQPAGAAGKNPSHTLHLRSSFAVSDDKEFEVGLRKVAQLSSPVVPAYTAIDARFGWKVRPNVELAITGQNLNGAHAEYGPVATRSEHGRMLGVSLVWRN